MNYSEEFRAFRKENDLSQQMLSKALGIVLRTVQGIELGEHKPSYTTRFRFKALRKRYEEAKCLPLRQ